jgi:uncharacterized membrane protein YhaH (DUF805 family)
MAHSFAITHVGNGLPAFWLGLVWLCFNIYMIYSLYGRRLHDMNLSVGPWFSTLFVTLILVGVTYWGAGGGEYMSTIMADNSIVEDEARFKALTETYQQQLAENRGWAGIVNLIPATALTLLCAIKPSFAQANKYGNAV